MTWLSVTPNFYLEGNETMTEEQVERIVERITDSVDRAFMRGDFGQEAYDKTMRELNEWAEAKRKGV